MAEKLKDYRKKRNFSKTPEPSASKADAGGFRFVVHKHNARNLHYDLRLEHNGVLKSWAIPKGISFDPAQKHLAVMVEDHPFDYKDFEGVIPEGNYGAGEVIIWDEGTYAPLGYNGTDPAEGEKLMAQGLAKGHVTVIFSGKKLKGEFALVRFKREDNQWLIIKKADEYANSPNSGDERSARSGKTIEDLKEDPPGDSKMPDFVEPMLATLVEEPFDRPGWIFEVKWDGYRTIAIIHEGKTRLLSRNGKVYTGEFPDIAAALSRGPNAIYDGEMVVLDKDGRSDFQLLQEYLKTGKGTAVYYVFDCLYKGSEDLRASALEERRKVLESVLPVSNIVRLSGYVAANGTGFYRAAEQNALEGIIAKNLKSRYRSGERSREWLKIKALRQQEAIVSGFTEGRASRKYFGALVLGVYRDGTLSFAGHAGGGFDDAGLKEMYAKLKPLITDKSPFEHTPKTNMPVTWVKPELIVEVKFREWTTDGLMRQPIVLGLRDDKNPGDVVQEMADKQFIKTKAVLTHLEKVYWPEEGYTKKDVIDYYWRMADCMLPYLKDRPQSLNRHPNGITGENFFQKNIGDTAPPWASTVKVPMEEKTITALLCQDRDTLIYIANLGCIEINVWSSSAGSLDKPDYMVFDFDPVEVPFSRVVEAVLETKKVLDDLGAPAFCKTTGGKGMHIYVPVKPGYDYEQTKNAANLIGMAVKRRLPALVSLERMPAKRKGKVYMDYLQNHCGATMAAPYSLRPREGAKVSTPLDWKEVTSRLDPADYNIKTMLKRVEEKGDLWKGLFKKNLDLKKALDTLQKLL